MKIIISKADYMKLKKRAYTVDRSVDSMLCDECRKVLAGVKQTVTEDDDENYYNFVEKYDARRERQRKDVSSAFREKMKNNIEKRKFQKFKTRDPWGNLRNKEIVNAC